MTKIEAKPKVRLTRREQDAALAEWENQWKALFPQEQAAELARTAGPGVEPDMKLFNSASPEIESTAGGTDTE